MTQEEAKALSLEVWEYFRDHPKVSCKSELPRRLYSRIENLRVECPLCELFFENEGKNCPRCPLGNCAIGSLYRYWARCLHKDRAVYAGKIVEAIKAWTPSIS